MGWENEILAGDSANVIKIIIETRKKGKSSIAFALAAYNNEGGRVAASYDRGFPLKLSDD